MLKELDGTQVKAVAIGEHPYETLPYLSHALTAGGIKSTNALHCLHGSVSTTGHALDGLAVVSDIVASSEPKAAAGRLASIIRAFKSAPPPVFSISGSQYTADNIKEKVASLVPAVRRHGPLVQQVRIEPLSSRARIDMSLVLLDHKHGRDNAVRQCDASARRVAHHGYCT